MLRICLFFVWRKWGSGKEEEGGLVGEEVWERGSIGGIYFGDGVG